MGKPGSDDKDPEDVLIVVGIGNLVALPQAIGVGLGVGVVLLLDAGHIVLPEDLGPHKGVHQFEEGFREGIGQHDQVDVIDEYMVLLLFPQLAVLVPVHNVDHEAGVQDVQPRVVEAERRMVVAVRVVPLDVGEQLDHHPQQRVYYHHHYCHRQGLQSDHGLLCLHHFFAQGVGVSYHHELHFEGYKYH